MTTRPFFITGAVAIIFILFALYMTIWVQDMPPDGRILNMQQPVLLSVVTSVAASAVFFFVVEALRSYIDRDTVENASRLHRLQNEIGIREVYASKSQREIIAEYKRTIATARYRIWALGLSNNQFVDQHSLAIRHRKHAYPGLDVRVHFFDPDATVCSPAITDSDFPLVNIFDFPTHLYRSEKRKQDAHSFAQRVLADRELDARVFFVLIPCYFSMMIVDDTAFFFPYLMAPEDASSNPMMMVDTTGEIGARLVDHVAQLSANPLLCRECKTNDTA